jgi:hypothetical protein
MYVIVAEIVFSLLTVIGAVLPLSGRFRRWALDAMGPQKRYDENFMYEYLKMFERGVKTPAEALGLVVIWFLFSCVLSLAAFVVTLVWPIAVLLVPMTFLFYKLFKQK